MTDVSAERDHGTARPRRAVAAADVVLAVASGGMRLGRRATRTMAGATNPVISIVLRPPLVADRYRPGRWLRKLAEAGRQDRRLAERELQRAVRELVPAVVTLVLDQLDLTSVIRERVDLDEVVRGVDVNAIVARVDLDGIASRLDVDAVAARVDVDAIVDRIDLVGLARYVVAEIDLPEIIRESTGSLASETVRGVRIQSIEADQLISSWFERVLHPRRRLLAAEAQPPPLEDGSS
jgi:hypothetical protein